MGPSNAQIKAVKVIVFNQIQSQMAVFSDGGTTSPDIYVGTSCILLVIVCTVLNTLVFKHNYLKKISVARNLYLCLSATDLLSSWVLMGTYSVLVLKEKPPECWNSEEPICNQDYYKRATKAGLDTKIFTVLAWTALHAPYHITGFLAMSRYYQIRYPLRHLPYRFVFITLCISVAPVPVIVGWAIFDIRDEDAVKPIQIPLTGYAWGTHPRQFGADLSYRGFFMIRTSATMVIQLGALITSLLTINQLVKDKIHPVAGRRLKKSRGSMKILITNLGSLLAVLSYSLTSLTSEEGVKEITFAASMVYFVYLRALPSVISTVNPVIYISFTPRFFENLLKNRARPMISTNC